MSLFFFIAQLLTKQIRIKRGIVSEYDRICFRQNPIDMKKNKSHDVLFIRIVRIQESTNLRAPSRFQNDTFFDDSNRDRQKWIYWKRYGDLKLVQTRLLNPPKMTNKSVVILYQIRRVVIQPLDFACEIFDEINQLSLLTILPTPSCTLEQRFRMYAFSKLKCTLQPS